MKNNENLKIFLRLIGRSADIGDGWRQVSDALWRHATVWPEELIDVDAKNKRVRMTPEGRAVMKYSS